MDLRLLEAAGIGRYLRQLVPRITERLPAEYLFLGDPAAIRDHDIDRASGVRIADARAPIYSIAEQLELRRLVPPGIDLFWAPHYNIPLLRVPRLVVTVHDVLHLARPEFTPGLHRRAYARAMFGAIRRRAAAIVADSRFTARELARLADVALDRITVVHPGLEPAWFEPVAAERPHPKPYFLCVGNLKPHKNLGRAIAAFASLADSLPHDLVVIGKREGFLTGDRESHAAAASLPERIHLLGNVPDARLRAYLRHAEALVFPSLYEGFGLPPLEAMASGCPALVARAASIPEVCGDAALYFDPLDVGDIAGAMRRVATSAALRDELREMGHARARGFPAEAAAEHTADVLRRVLA